MSTDESDRPDPDDTAPSKQQVQEWAREAAVDTVANELDSSDLPVSRRQVLAALGVTAVGSAAVGGASGATASGSTGPTMSIAATTENTYLVPDKGWLGGPAAARTELNSELDSNDAGAKYLGQDNGHLYHWTGSGWTDLGRFNTNNPVVDSLTTDDLNTKTRASTYVVYTDETDIWAIPQENPADAALSKVTDTDIGNLLTELIKNQLPPQGDQYEANGKVRVKRGDYPGDLSNGDSTLNGTILPSGCHIIGEHSTHDESGSTKSTIPTTEPPVRFSFTTNGFVAPNNNSDFMIYPRLADIQLDGPGTSTDSVGLDDQNSNPWDWAFFDRVVVQECGEPYAGSNDAVVFFTGCQFRRFKSSAVNRTTMKNRLFFRGCFMKPVDGHIARLEQAHLVNCQLGGLGESATAFELYPGTTLIGCRGEKGGGTNGSGDFIKTNNAAIYGLHLIDGDWGTAITAQFNDLDVGGVIDETSSTNTLKAGSSAGKIYAMGPLANGVANPSNATQIYRNGQPTNQQDLTSVTGDYDGQMTLADGTSTSASSGDIGIWDDGNSQWNIWNADATE